MSILQFAVQSHGLACPAANDEIRMTNVEGKEEMPKLEVQSLVIRTSSLIRDSSFVIRHS